MDVTSLATGQVLETTRTIDEDDIKRCAELTGDFGAHHIAGLAGRPIAQGLLTAAAAPLLRQEGGFRLAEMSLTFLAPVFAGDTVRASVTVTAVEEQGEARRVRFALVIRNQDGTDVITGEGAGAFGAPSPGGRP